MSNQKTREPIQILVYEDTKRKYLIKKMIKNYN